MAHLAARLLRHAYRREMFPPIVRWTLAAAGMRDWIRGLSSALRPVLGDQARPILAELFGELARRRYAVLREDHPSLPDPDADPRAVALVLAALYQMDLAPRARWIFADLGGAPRTARERLRAQRLTLALSPSQRWVEVATHLGELLIVITERLPERLPRTRQILARICFDMGERYAKEIVRLFGLPEDGDKPAQAIEVLRMAEYLFHVNPEHRGHSDPSTNTGWLEGDACLWWKRPGWTRGHCGIFGQFQAGVASVFGLTYRLERTIPKHGGDVCRITLDPIPLGRRPMGLQTHESAT